jgi:hypothetical protein
MPSHADDGGRRFEKSRRHLLTQAQVSSANKHVGCARTTTTNNAGGTVNNNNNNDNDIINNNKQMSTLPVRDRMPLPMRSSLPKRLRRNGGERAAARPTAAALKQTDSLSRLDGDTRHAGRLGLGRCDVAAPATGGC